MIHTIDTHTAGESTRVVIHGYPNLPRTHPLTIKKLLAAEHDNLRRMLMWEPRGHQDMFGAVLLPPSQPDTQLGVVFMHTGGYLTACIHGTIGVIVAAVESGYIPEGQSNHPLKVETPSGIVLARFQRRAGQGLEVTVRNVASYVAESNMEVRHNGHCIRADVVYAGSFFAIVQASDIGLRVESGCIGDLIQAGVAIRTAINQEKSFTHPDEPDLAGVDLVEITDEPSNPRAHARNVVIFGPGQFDRSPCGTGTCARMTLLHRQGKLRLGQEFIHESILGTLFCGRIVEEQKVGPFPAVIPEITGTAFITATQQFVADPLDPLREGFLVGVNSNCQPRSES